MTEFTPNFHVVLFQPEIPPNTGNIGRTCVALGAKLWIVRPAGFRLDDSQIRRSGLDYWEKLTWEAVDDWNQLLEKLDKNRFWLFTKFASRPYTEVEFRLGDVFVFGNESSGLPDSIHREFEGRRLILPMPGPIRCLNLATTAGIALYEAARQVGWDNMIVPE